ncbi:hypothetical protein VUR80DRAFT_6656 [Thermomyces stellatus]
MSMGESLTARLRRSQSGLSGFWWLDACSLCPALCSQMSGPYSPGLGDRRKNRGCSRHRPQSRRRRVRRSSSMEREGGLAVGWSLGEATVWARWDTFPDWAGGSLRPRSFARRLLPCCLMAVDELRSFCLLTLVCFLLEFVLPPLSLALLLSSRLARHRWPEVLVRGYL